MRDSRYISDVRLAMTYSMVFFRFVFLACFLLVVWCLLDHKGLGCTCTRKHLVTMMNSSSNDDDEFGENPFRSPAAGGTDFFSDAPAPAPQAQFQQPPASQFPPMQQHQQFQPQGGSFEQVPQDHSSLPPPSGPMDNMGPQQQQQQSQMQPPGPPRGCWGTFTMLLDLNTYKSYFDVDADDIVTRVKSVYLDFYKPEHFRNNVLGAQQTNGLKGPDLYGPYWVTMTLIFLVGVSVVQLCFELGNSILLVSNRYQLN
jgi:hypothetical protein